MNKASPIDMRKALEKVEALRQAGILFEPVPVLDETHQEQLQGQAAAALAKMLEDVE